MSLGFFIPQGHLSFPGKGIAQCMFCKATYNSNGWVPSKLGNHLESQHNDHVNKSEQFFKNYYKNNFVNSSQFFKKTFNKNISPAVLSSIDVAHILMKRKKPFTDAEETIKECVIQIVDNFFGKTAVEQVKKIPLSDTTIARRCILVAKDLKEQLLEKLRDCTCFGLQLDESVDVSGEAQLLVYCRFPDITTSKMSEHMLFCDPVGVQTTGKSIFTKLDNFFTTEKLQWKYCVAVTTDGAAAMVGIHKGLNAFIKTKNPDCKFLHCMLHREALVAKKLKPKGSETHTLEKTFSDVVKIINEIRTRPRVSREFSDFCQESLADHDTLILHSEVRFLSRGKVLKRCVSSKSIVFNSKEECKC